MKNQRIAANTSAVITGAARGLGLALAVAKLHAQINVLIYNAGVSRRLPFEIIPLPEFERVMRVNFYGTVYVARYFRPYSKTACTAQIVNGISDFVSRTTPAALHARMCGKLSRVNCVWFAQARPLNLRCDLS